MEEEARLREELAGQREEIDRGYEAVIEQRAELARRLRKRGGHADEDLALLNETIGEILKLINGLDRRLRAVEDRTMHLPPTS